MRGAYGNPERQGGLALVEFAIVGAVAITMIFAVIEISRAMFVANALTEATRRGARMAVVCPINDPAIAQVTIFSASGAGDVSPIVWGLDTSNVVLEYLDRNGVVIANPADNFFAIRYIQVRIANFQQRLLIPFVNLSFAMPGFATRLPRESLGVTRDGSITPC